MTYHPESNKFYLWRFFFEYFKSIQASKNSELSWRIPSPLKNLFLKKPIQLTCPENTLVLADVHGFHGRSINNTGKNAKRLQIHFSIPRRPKLGLG